MKIVSLTLQNFRRYEQETIEFPDGLIGIVGRNGAGKTTLVEAIGWCLYGDPAARSGKEEILRTEATEGSECKVVVELILGSDTMRIERSLRGKNSTGQAKLFLNGESEASVTGTTEVSNYITTRMGMDHIAFFTSIFAKQKELAGLSNETKTNRKKIVLRLLRVDKIDQVISLIRSDIRENKKILEFIQQTLEDIDELENSLASLETEQSSLSLEIEKMKSNVDILKKTLDTAQQEFANLEQKYKEYQQIQKEIADLNGQIIGANKEKNGVESDLGLAIKSQQKLIEIKPQLDKFEEIKLKKQKLDSLQLLYTEKNSLQKQYGEYNKQIVSKTKEIGTLVSKLKSYEGIDKLQQEILHNSEKLQESYENNKAEESKIQSILDEKIHQKDLLQQEFDEIKSLGNQSVCPKCKRQLGPHVVELSKHYTKEISELQKSIDIHIKEKSKKSVKIKNILNDIKLKKTKEDKLRKKIDLRTILKTKFNETTKTLMSLKSQQSKILTGLSKYSDVKYDKKKHSQISTQFQQLDRVNKNAIALSEQAKSITALQKRIESINDTISMMNKKIVNYNKRLFEIDFSDQKYETTKKSKSTIESDYYEQREVLTKRGQYLIQVSDKILQQKQTIEKEKEKKQMKERAENKINSLQKLDSIMNEFKIDLISRIRPQLSVEHLNYSDR